MSWREVEFSHEGAAYTRSLDQVNDTPLEAIAGYHVREDGQSVCDWFQCQGKKVTMHYLGPQVTHVYLKLEGVPQRYRLRIPRNGHFVLAARLLADKVLARVATTQPESIDEWCKRLGIKRHRGEKGGQEFSPYHGGNLAHKKPKRHGK
jgi:hypothetical protein